MITKAKEAKSLFLWGVLGFFVAVFCLLGQKALAQSAAPSGTGQPQPTQEEINSQQETKDLIDQILSQPIVKGPFTGKEEADLEEVYPLYLSPLSDFNLIFDKNLKQSYKKGENIQLGGNLKYAYQAKAEIDKVKAENCQSGNSCNVLESPYQMPLFADVGIFVQVWRKDTVNRLLGDQLVDEFYASQGATLKENENEPFTLNWEVPAGIQKGEYYLSFFVNGSKRFNFKGTPLVSFFPAATFDFDVTGEGEEGIALDKDNITVNGKKFSYRQSAPGIDLAEGKVDIETGVFNLDAKETLVNVKCELFSWSQEDQSSLLKSQEETKTVKAKSKENISFSFSPAETESVYNLKITAATANSKSVSNIRFVVNDRSRGIFRFLGLAQKDNRYYPLICLMDAAWKGYFEGKVKLTLTDADQKTIGAWEKEGKIIPDEKCFVVKSKNLDIGRNAGAVKLKGEVLSKEGKSLDEKVVSYQLGAEPKNQAGLAKPAQSSDNREGSSSLLFLMVILLALIIAGGMIHYLNKRKVNKINNKG